MVYVVLESKGEGTDRNVFADECIFILIFTDETALAVVPLVSQGNSPPPGSVGGGGGGLLLNLSFDLDLIVSLAAPSQQLPHVLVAVDEIADEAERTREWIDVFVTYR